MHSETERLNEIIRLGTELNTIQDMDILLQRILLEAQKVVNADAGSIYICKGNKLEFSYSQNDTQQKELLPGQKLPYASFSIDINTNSIAGYVAYTGEILNIPDVYAISKNAPYHFDSNVDHKSNYKTKSMITVPMKNNIGKIIGVLQMINAKNRKNRIIPFPLSDEPFVLHFANTASIVLQRAQMTRALLLRMISMAELRDPKETGHHVNRVASYAVELYERWAHLKKIPKEEIESKRDILRMAAMLHDVGKVAISDIILKKPGPLSGEEYEIMKTHAFQGAKLLGDIQSDFDEIASVIALTHHENWDGTGYPGRIEKNIDDNLKKDLHEKPTPLKGEEIPIYGRITALADVYDALSSKRVYKDAWKIEDVLKEIRNLSGKKFDPELVDVFFDSLELIESIRHRYPDE
jgi:HD-GYP domain-containing protein (c-di-GMP phosphodiesterase class II)